MSHSVKALVEALQAMPAPERTFASDNSAGVHPVAPVGGGC